jgi:cyclophilin family peptidyl-prolyl cis-trans isomerase
MAQLKETYGEKLGFVYRHFPLSSHDKAEITARAAVAADLQGKFWEMHDVLFEKQAEWAGLSMEEFRNWIDTQAGDLGLERELFLQDLDSEAVAKRVQRDLDEATSLGLPGTPTLVINGQFYSGPLDLVNLSAIFQLILLQERQYESCPPTLIDLSRQYRATILTEKGEIVIELFAEQAPLAVNNFIFLARNDWYDDVTFHRVLPDFVAQAGDPTGTGFGGPGYAFKNETHPDLVFDREGLVAMANAGPDSNGSQFFITYGPQEQLNGGYTIFGRVIEGMDVARSLSPRNPATDPGASPGDKILDVVIEER